MTDRIIVLLDMDCFYVQVEEREYPQMKGKPAAVVQYNTWKGGGIIAVNYEARSFGVNRGMRGDEAKEKCPEIHLFQVPVQREKADLTKYRNAGKEVVTVLCKFSDCVERASIDEAYIDFTKIIEEELLRLRENKTQTENLPSTWVVGYDEENEEIPSQTLRHNGLSNWLNETFDSSLEAEQSNILRLSAAAEICEEMRRKVFEETGFRCSAGISHNKMLAKLACGLHKPNQQTVLPMNCVPTLWARLPIGKVRNLGGKLGDSISSDFACKTMGDLSNLTIEQLRSKYDEKTASWLFSLGRGIENEVVTSRQLPKSIGCSKNFNGKDILNTKQKVNTWMKSLTDELSERLLEDQASNNRIAKTLTVHIRVDSEDKPITSRSSYLPSYKSEVIAKVAMGIIATLNTASSKEENWDPPIRNISLSAGKFDNLLVDGTTKINDFFKKVDPSTSRSNISQIDEESDEEVTLLPDEKDKKVKPKIIEKKKKKVKVEKNLQKSFFLQFLSQNSSEKMRKKYLAESVSSKSANEEDVLHHPVGVEKDIDHSDDDDYNKSTDIDEEPEPVDVIDISSRLSPVLKSKRSRSPCIETPRTPELISTQDSPIIRVIKSKRSKSQYLEAPRTPELIRTQDSPSTIELSESPELPNTPEPLELPISPPEPQQQNFASTSKRRSSSDEGKSESISVREIFPDLDNVDWSVANMLPPSLRDKVYEEVERHKRLTTTEIDLTEPSQTLMDSKTNNLTTASNDKFTFCRECNRKILTCNFVEHSDFHFATELRKQQMVDVRSSLMSTSRKRENGKTSPLKSNKNKRQKNISVTANFTPKIENYFKKK